MKPCDINNIKVIKDQLKSSDLKAEAAKSDAMIFVETRPYGVTVNISARDTTQPGKAFGYFKKLMKDVNRVFAGGKNIIYNSNDSKQWFDIRFNKETLDIIQEFAVSKKAKKSKSREDRKKSTDITPRDIQRVLSDYRGSTIGMKEGSDYVVDGEVYPTYEDALQASNKEDATIFSANGDVLSKEAQQANSKRLKEQFFPTSDISSVSQILFKIANSDHPLNQVAKHLMKYSNINDVVISLKDVQYFTNSTTNIKAIGQYNPNKNQIDIAGKSGSKKIETLLVHEILHALSYRNLRNNSEYNKDFKKLYEKSKEKLGGFNEKSLQGEYANYSIDEFFVAIFTDGAFIQKLQSLEAIDIKKYPNLFEEIMDYLLSILGFVSTDNLYSQAMAIASNILQHEYDTQQSLMMENEYYDSLQEPLFSIDDNVKPGVDFVFEQTPELASIGTQKQYSNYLNTIFPDSQVKDIVYHGTDTNIDKFDKNFRGKNTGDSGFTDGTPIDSSNAFFFSSSINSTFQYSFIKQLEKIASITNVLNNLIFNYTASNAANVRKVDENLANHLREKQAELVTEEKMKAYLNILYNKYNNANKELGVGFLNQYNNLYNSRKEVKKLKTTKNNILNGNYKNNDYVYIYDDIGNSYVSIDKEGKITSSNKEINQKNITDITSEQFNNIIEKGEENTTKFFKKLEEYKNKYKLNPKTYNVIINVQNPTIKDFEGIPFVQQMGDAKSALYDASKLTQQAVKDGRDSVIFKNIKDPYLADNYGVFEPEQIHILGSKQDIQGFKEFVGGNNNLTGKLKNPTYNSQKEYYLATSTKGLLENIVKFTKDSDTKALATSLLQIKNIDTVRLNVTKYNKNTNDKGSIGSSTSTLGTYNSFTELINIIGTLDKNTFESVFLHEVVHAVTVNEYYSNKEFNTKINTLYNYTLKFKDYRTSTSVSLGQMYGMTNAKEFMSEAMSNPDFIYELSKYYSPLQEKLKEKNIFEEFIDIVVNLIKTKIENKGKKYIENNLGTSLLNVISNYSNIPNKRFIGTQFYKQQTQTGPGVSKDSSNILFNLNKKDNSRKAVNNRLNNLLSKTLNKIKVEVLDKKTGELKIQSVKVKTIEAYKKWHSNEYAGEVVDALGVANILDGIIAYSTEDGITLPEETIHFIVELILETPEIQTLLTKTDDNGVRLIETTKVYNDNVKEYTEKYQDSTLVDKEIIGKLIAQYMYDSRRVKSFRNRVLKLIQSVLKKLFINVKLAYTLNPKEYPIEFRQALGIIDSNITADKYITATNNTILRKPTSLGVVTANPASKLARVKNSLSEMIKRYDQLLQESENKGKDWNDYKALFHNLGLTLDVDDGVHMLTPQRIADFKAKVLVALQSDPNNVDLANQFIGINKLEKMYNTFEKSKSDTTSLYSLEYRLAKVRKYYETKNYEEGLNVFLFGTGNVEGKDYTDFNYNEHGAIYDMFKAASKVKELLNTPELIRTDHIAQITEVLATYVPIIEIIEQTYIGSGNKLFENDDLRNTKVGEALQLINEYTKEVHDFINSNDAHYNAQRNAYLDELSADNVQDINEAVNNLVDRNSPREYTELSQFKKVVGLYKNAQEGWLRIFSKRLKTVMNAVKQRNYSDAISIYNQLNTLGYDKLSASQVEKTFYQLDSKGKPTGYINTERDVAGWVKSREEYRDSIPKLLRQIANASTDPYMKSLNIPTDYNELMQKFTPIYALEKEDKKNLTPEMQALWKLRDAYSKLWSEWEEANTEQFQEDEVEKITEERRQQLSRYHFNKWYSENIKTYTRFDGQEVTYYSGELRRPKKINETWNKLSANQKRMAELYAEDLKRAKLSALPDKYNFEWLTRAPQITKTMFDSVTGGNRYATAKERLGGILNERIDDDFYNADKEGQVIKIPPLRYNKKLPDPGLLTNDVLRALITYKNSINHRNIFLSAMPELQGMIDMVSTSTVKTQQSRFFSSSTKEGRSSNLKAGMDHLMETIVFGNTEIKIGGSERATSFFRSGKAYVTSLNLAYNSASMITSWLSSETDKLVNASIGDLFDMQDYKKGQKEFLANMHNIFKDFENPIKNTKLGALSVVMEVGNTTVSNMSKTNVSRASRMVVGATKPFSGWNTTEMLQSLPIIATMGMSIKNIDGAWMTKQQANKNKIDKKLWNSAKSVYDTLEVKDGVIDFKDIPQNIIDLYFIKTQHAISQMSQALSETDKGTMYKNAAFSFLGVHMSWLIQQLDKMYGSEIYNYETGQNEMGYYKWNSLKYTAEVGATAIKGTLQSMMSMKLNFQEFKELMDVSINPHNEAKIRNTKRIGVQMAIITAISLLSYMLVGLALDDEEDEQLSPVLQMAALLALKVRVEQGAKLSLKDMHEFAQKPLSNYDASFNRFQFINSAMDIISGEDEEYTKDNIYSGMNKSTVNLIRTTPYLKGIMESYLGWYLNENLSGEISEQARAMKSKREGTVSFVLEPKGQGADLAIKTAFDAFALPAYILGNTGGKGMLQILDSSYPENRGLLNSKLPSKKANLEEEDEE